MPERTDVEKIIVVTDVGPLISALQCERVDLLKRYFSVMYLTVSELAELDRHGWTDEIRRLIHDGLVVVVELLTEAEKAAAEHVAKQIAADPVSGDLDWQHHLPEAEAMVVMQQRAGLMIEQILLDEKAARNVARMLGLRLTGFPGVLGRAGLDGLVSHADIRRLWTICQQQGTHYSDELIESVAQTYGR